MRLPEGRIRGEEGFRRRRQGGSGTPWCGFELEDRSPVGAVGVAGLVGLTGFHLEGGIWRGRDEVYSLLGRIIAGRTALEAENHIGERVILPFNFDCCSDDQ